MIYDLENMLPFTEVYDVDLHKPINYVVSIDTDRAELVCHVWPPKVEGGELAKIVIRFRAIQDIAYNQVIPSVFHCYGRLL
jgi:hypothetical protein